MLSQCQTSSGRQVVKQVTQFANTRLWNDTVFFVAPITIPTSPQKQEGKVGRASNTNANTECRTSKRRPDSGRRTEWMISQEASTNQTHAQVHNYASQALSAVTRATTRVRLAVKISARRGADDARSACAPDNFERFAQSRAVAPAAAAAAKGITCITSPSLLHHNTPDARRKGRQDSPTRVRSGGGADLANGLDVPRTWWDCATFRWGSGVRDPNDPKLGVRPRAMTGGIS